MWEIYFKTRMFYESGSAAVNTQANDPQAITLSTLEDSNRSQTRDAPCLRNLMRTGWREGWTGAGEKL